MNEIEAIKKYLAWSQDQIEAGNPMPTVEQYEEAMRIADLEDRMQQIHEIASRPMEAWPANWERLELIKKLSEPSE